MAALRQHYPIVLLNRIIWSLISDAALPVIEGRKTGY